MGYSTRTVDGLQYPHGRWVTVPARSRWTASCCATPVLLRARRLVICPLPEGTKELFQLCGEQLGLLVHICVSDRPGTRCGTIHADVVGRALSWGRHGLGAGGAGQPDVVLVHGEAL